MLTVKSRRSSSWERESNHAVETGSVRRRQVAPKRARVCHPRGSGSERREFVPAVDAVLGQPCRRGARRGGKLHLPRRRAETRQVAFQLVGAMPPQKEPNIMSQVIYLEPAQVPMY